MAAISGLDASRAAPARLWFRRAFPDTVPMQRYVILLVGGAGCVLAPLAMLVDAPSLLRVPAALALFAFAPGASLLPLLRLRARAADTGLVVVTSIGVLLVAAQAMLWADAWSPAAGAYLVAALALPSIAIQLGRVRITALPPQRPAFAIPQRPITPSRPTSPRASAPAVPRPEPARAAAVLPPVSGGHLAHPPPPPARDPALPPPIVPVSPVRGRDISAQGVARILAAAESSARQIRADAEVAAKARLVEADRAATARRRSAAEEAEDLLRAAHEELAEARREIADRVAAARDSLAAVHQDAGELVTQIRDITTALATDRAELNEMREFVRDVTDDVRAPTRVTR